MSSQQPLFGPKRPPKVMRRSIDATIAAARADGRLPAGDCAEVTELRLLADRLDRLRIDPDTKVAYAEAAIHRELRETLLLYGLAGRDDSGDAIDRLLTAMDIADDSG